MLMFWQPFQFCLESCFIKFHHKCWSAAEDRHLAMRIAWWWDLAVAFANASSSANGPSWWRVIGRMTDKYNAAEKRTFFSLFFSGPAASLFTTRWQKLQQNSFLFFSNHTSCLNTWLELIHYLWLNATRPASLQQKLLETQSSVKNAPDDFLSYHANETQVSVLARRHVSPHCNMCSPVESAQKLLRVRPKTKMDQLRQDFRRFYSCYLSLSELMDFPPEYIFIV